MKFLTVLALGVLACCATAQTEPSRFSLSLAYDVSARRTTPVAAYRIGQQTDVLGFRGFNLDVQGIASLETNVSLGFALTYSRPVSRETRLMVGPWFYYRDQVVRGGVFFGVGGSF